MARVLCVEDEAAIREDIVEELQEAGHEVLQAEDGRQALPMILQHRPDIVVSDINMPHMNGAQLLVSLRKNHPQFDGVPFIFLTAFADRSDVIKGSRLGADDYLTKPVDFELLSVKIEQHLRNIARVKQQNERQAAVPGAKRADPVQPSGAGHFANVVKSLHRAKIVIIGGMDSEQRHFSDFLSRNGFRVVAFMDEVAYCRKAEQLPVHFTLLWNYTYHMHRTFCGRMAKLSAKSICIRVFPESARDTDDYVAIDAINNVLRLPVAVQELELKLMQLVQEKISS